MKQRVISGAIIAAITIISAYVGGLLLAAVLTFVALYGSYEFVKIRREEFNYLVYAIMALTCLGIMYLHDYATVFVLLELIFLLTISVFDEKEPFDDIAATFLMTVMIGYAMYFMLHIQQQNKWMFGYVLIISYLTDVFAFFVGIKFGKHKLNTRVSPKKTIEGSLGGWFFGCVTSFIWAAIFSFFGRPVYQFVVASLCLPIVSEIGDLVFSLVKRHYGVKDFSNLIPGHGGILDRLDSHIFCIILFGVLLTIFK
ncbi:MAG: phosphatidate cytidylyltransferase [Erysipelotrichaceae bacterium]|nr:phosphatidate cytidylyltransferase [Erysipelotrichaceae bacterium]